MSTTLFQTPARIINGYGTFATLAAEVKRANASRVLLVIDPFLVQIGFGAETIGMLEAAGIAVAIFDKIEPDPRCEIANEAAGVGREFKADTVVAIGGGSTLDIAKVAAVLIPSQHDVREFVGIDKVAVAGLRTILVPTTAGTGSEVTNIAILSDEIAQLKVGVVSSHLIAHTVLLDAKLTVGLPPAGTAASGMDALIHAIEAYTSVPATEHTDLYAEKAIKLIGANLRAAYSRGSNIAAREAMLTGSFYAGLAFSNSGCAAVHAFAYPIGARFHIPHGIANTIMLMPVLKRNLPACYERYGHIAQWMGENISGLSPHEAAQKCITALNSLIEDLRVPRHLADYGVKATDVDSLGEDVMQVTRLLGNNPYVIRVEDAKQIYAEAL